MHLHASLKTLVLCFMLITIVKTENNVEKRSESTLLEVCNDETCQASDETLKDSTATILELVGTANITQETEGRLNISSKINIIHLKNDNCPQYEGVTNLTQLQLIEYITAPCRYDRFERPMVMINGSPSDEPVNVFVRLDISIQSTSDSDYPQFDATGILRLRYNDPRLAFKTMSKQNILIGKTDLRQKIWYPEMYFSNKYKHKALTVTENDIFTSIAPDGEVVLSFSIQVTLYCWMNLQKFPFDVQICSTFIENWMYNTSQLLVNWDKTKPFNVNSEMSDSEFTMENVSYNATFININSSDIMHYSQNGNFSALSFSIYLSRQSGYYILEYFLPSIMIVAISWVSFWLQADQTPARTTLGTTTMLSFITLASSQEDNLPKVNYIKISDIWFLGCTFFIFGSLIEFAFSNTIWRRKHNVELKRVSSKYILKNTVTPQNNRHRLKIPSKMKKVASTSSELTRFSSSPLFVVGSDTASGIDRQDSTYGSISANESTSAFTFNIDANVDNTNNINVPEPPKKRSWSSMTPAEVSHWIDRKSRFLFPLAYIIFNGFFWAFVYCL